MDDIFLREHNLGSSINYLLLTLLCFLVAFGIYVLMNKKGNKKVSEMYESLKKETDNNKEKANEDIDIEWITFFLNYSWKFRMKEYLSYKMSLFVIGIYIIMNVVSFASKGQIFVNVYVRVFYELYWILVLTILFETYSFLKDRRKWKFDQDKNLMVFTDSLVLEKKAKIKLVAYSNDGTMSFLSGKHTIKNAKIVSLKEIINQYPVCAAMSILPKGFIAIKKQNKWIIEKDEND